MTEPEARSDLVQHLSDLRAGLDKLSQPLSSAEAKQGDEEHADGGKVTAVQVARQSDMIELRQKALHIPKAALQGALATQMAHGTKEGAGIPFEQWATPDTAKLFLGEGGRDNQLSKFIDTVSGNVLIRQDLEPLIYAAFVRRFPAFARVPKIPANGLTHTFQRVDARPAVTYIAETATVPDSQAQYTRGQSNISVLAVRVGTSLKQSLSVAAGGMPWNTEQQEIMFGIESFAAQTQQTFLQGNATIPAGAADDDGPYDALAFDGLRRTVPTANERDIGTDTVLEGFNQADLLVVNLGGTVSAILISATDNVQFTNELQPFRRFTDSERVDVVPGLPRVAAVNLAGSGQVPVIPVPGADWAAYVNNDVGAGATGRDAFLLDESALAMPYLGSETPTVIELPLGVTGALTKLYILVCFYGLAVRVPNFTSKLFISPV